MTVGGVTSLVLSTIEKRFQFSSKEAGFIAASNDISAILLTSFISFYGGYANKPKWLGLGSLLTGKINVDSMDVLLGIFAVLFQSLAASLSVHKADFPVNAITSI